MKTVTKEEIVKSRFLAENPSVKIHRSTKALQTDIYKTFNFVYLVASILTSIESLLESFKK